MHAIKCIFWGSAASAELAPAEVVKLRNEYRGVAQDILKSTGTDHVLYYRDERDECDSITTAHFYVRPQPMTEDEFFAAIKAYNKGIIGAVHALR